MSGWWIFFTITPHVEANKDKKKNNNSLQVIAIVVLMRVVDSSSRACIGTRNLATEYL